MRSNDSNGQIGKTLAGRRAGGRIAPSGSGTDTDLDRYGCGQDGSNES